MNGQTESMRWETKILIFLLISSCLVTTGICACFSSALFLANKATQQEFPAIEDSIEPSVACPRVPEGWRIVKENTFDENVNKWPLGKASDEYDTTNLMMEGGVLRYEVTAHKEVYSHQHPGLGKSLENFYMTADIQKVSGPRDAEYGVVFRARGERQVVFSIQDSGMVAVTPRDVGGVWQDDWLVKYSNHVEKDQSNQFVVYVHGWTYTFCINQFIVGEVESSTYPSGQFGIGVFLDAGDKAVFEIDNFNIYAPEE